MCININKVWLIECCCEQNIRFDFVTNSLIQDIISLDSKQFHINVLGGENVTFSRVRVIAPENSPNTDGIHIGRSIGINIIDTTIQTGDDCISLGDGSKQISITNVWCGPGHGISVGSLGKYPNEDPVEGVFVRNCTIKNASNGVRIKTWPDSYDGLASNMHFEDIIMENVGNPVLIDQEYCPWNQCNAKVILLCLISNYSSTMFLLDKNKSIFWVNTIMFYLFIYFFAIHHKFCFFPLLNSMYYFNIIQTVKIQIIPEWYSNRCIV